MCVCVCALLVCVCVCRCMCQCIGVCVCVCMCVILWVHVYRSVGMLRVLMNHMKMENVILCNEGLQLFTAS